MEAFRVTEHCEYQDLTPREKQVLERVAMGAANKCIALDLDMTEHTVKFHLAGVFRKLEVTNRTEAAATYLRLLAAR